MGSKHELCRRFLAAQRGLAREQGFSLPEMYVTEVNCTGRYFWVQDNSGGTLWQGPACCRWAARTKTILALTARLDEQEAAADPITPA